MLADAHIDPFFDAVVEATEEAIVNALIAAETMTGRDGITAYALEAETLINVLRRPGRLVYHSLPSNCVERNDRPGFTSTLVGDVWPRVGAPWVLFDAFSNPSKVAKWWGPAGFKIPSLDFNPRVGGGYRIAMRPPESEPFYLTGEFKEVDPSTRLAFTFVWEPPHPDDVESLVELSFRDLGESTEIVLTQGAFKTEARRELHRAGWTDSFDKLVRLLSQA
jgi:uncharacterized protein YndB with AHSA1/START domain